MKSIFHPSERAFIEANKTKLQRVGLEIYLEGKYLLA